MLPLNPPLLHSTLGSVINHKNPKEKSDLLLPPGPFAHKEHMCRHERKIPTNNLTEYPRLGTGHSELESHFGTEINSLLDKSLEAP